MSATPRPLQVIGHGRQLAIVGTTGNGDNTFPLLVLGKHIAGEEAKPLLDAIVRAVNREPLLDEARAALTDLIEAVERHSSGYHRLPINSKPMKHARLVAAQLAR